jgi:hypothetical protein
LRGILIEECRRNDAVLDGCESQENDVCKLPDNI